MPIPVGFWSNSATDDIRVNGHLSQLRVVLGKAIALQLGIENLIWQDIRSIPLGTDWVDGVMRAMSTTDFFVPVITPDYLKSKGCSIQVELFRNHVLQHGRRENIFPIQYERINEDSERTAALDVLLQHEWCDFRPLVHADIRSREVFTWLDNLAEHILQTVTLEKPQHFLLDSGKSVSAETRVDQLSRYASLFISYGGSDEVIAGKINDALKLRGIRTWFFPDDSVPGDKLHRVMHDGVNSHDRVLLICSRSSLVRSGVLNELERVLEREAREGGGSLLIPVALDDFVFSNWKPQNLDVAAQVRSRVICKVSNPETDMEGFNKTMNRLQVALKARD